jgi:S-adenosylmethionine:tRNA ribosyltransferase-isomerase
MPQIGQRNNLDSILDDLDLANYNYILPPERIAKYPLEERDNSKLLVYNRGMITKDSFSNFVEYINQDDFLVFNNSKVIQARLEFYKQSGARIEVFCLNPTEPADIQLAFQQTRKVTWKCLVGNLKKWKKGILTTMVDIHGGKVVLSAALKEISKTGIHVEFSWNNSKLSFSEVLEAAGQTPIPPYLNRNSEPIDLIRYQTVYSLIEGSVAAPTAGLHFTSDLLEKLHIEGVGLAELTLHVGIGTFRPIQSDSIIDHEMHTENFSVSLKAITQIRQKVSKLIAVGTTSVRTLESLYLLGAKIHKNKEIRSDELVINQWDGITEKSEIPPGDALRLLENYMIKNHMDVLYSSTRLMIIPGFKFKLSDVLLTNFHMPRSSLILLVAAFIGEDWKKVYQYALDNDFRFLSYGDSSLLLPKVQK